MAYNRLVAVDENYAFPPEVAEKFSTETVFVDAIDTYLSSPASSLPAQVQQAIEDLAMDSSPGLVSLMQAVVDAQADDPESNLYTLIQDQMLQTLTTTAPGAVQDYVERLTNFTTTNTNAVSTTAIVDGFDLFVVGTGRPVTLEFFTGSVYHSVANQFVGVYLITSVDGSAYSVDTFKRVAAESSPSTVNGRSLSAAWDIPTVEGAEYSFRMGVFGGGAGTSRLVSELDVNYPICWRARNH